MGENLGQLEIRFNPQTLANNAKTTTRVLDNLQELYLKSLLQEIKPQSLESPFEFRHGTRSVVRRHPTHPIPIHTNTPPHIYQGKQPICQTHTKHHQTSLEEALDQGHHADTSTSNTCHEKRRWNTHTPEIQHHTTATRHRS